MNEGDLVALFYGNSISNPEENIVLVYDGGPYRAGDLYRFHHPDGVEIQVNPYHHRFLFMEVVWVKLSSYEESQKTDEQRYVEYKEAKGVDNRPRSTA